MTDTKNSSPSIYLILGSPNSGQMEVARDLIEGALYWENEPVLFYPSEHCKAPAKEAHFKSIAYADWSEINPQDKCDAIFVVAQGHLPPPTQIEGLQSFLKRSTFELGRIISLVNCKLAIEVSQLEPWFDCCIHFSDYVLLSERKDVSQKAIKEFIKGYDQKCYPCHFEMLRKSGHVDNPAQILIPEPRRMATLFDGIDAIDSLDIDPDDLPDEIIDIELPEDKYLKRTPDGNPEIRLPDIMRWATP